MPTSHHASRHILAINHSPDVLALVAELLTDEGYRVTTRSDLDRDLQEIAGLAPDLIVIDYMWPTSDDNWSLLHLLRLHPSTAKIPILLCTGAVREAQQLESLLADLRITVLYKPFDIDRLIGAVHLALGLDLTAEHRP